MRVELQTVASSGLLCLARVCSKECRIIVRDESSVYFNVTAKHV